MARRLVRRLSSKQVADMFADQAVRGRAVLCYARAGYKAKCLYFLPQNLL